MSKQTLKFNDIVLNKKDYYASKKAIPLNLVKIKNIVIFYRIKHNDESCQHFIGSNYENNTRSLCIILPQMSAYIKYLENGERTCHLKLKMKMFT